MLVAFDLLDVDGVDARAQEPLVGWSIAGALVLPWSTTRMPTAN
jgi:hypothetical protein